MYIFRYNRPKRESRIELYTTVCTGYEALYQISVIKAKSVLHSTGNRQKIMHVLLLDESLINAG